MFGLSLARLLVYASIAVSMGGGIAIMKTQYDSSIIAKDAANIAAANLIIEHKQQADLASALEQWAVAAETRSASQSKIKDAIAHAKTSSACIGSAPILAAINGMRSNVNSH